MPTTFSPLRYPGGKTQFYESVVEIIDNNNLLGCTYIEPFAGGAGVALKLLQKGKVGKVILNDRDRAIYAFWKAAIVHTEKFCFRIETTPLTIYEWHRQKAIYSNPKSSLFDLGFATFFLNRTNRSGIIFSNPIGGILQNSTMYSLSCRFNKKDLIRKIRKIHDYRKQIFLFNQDAKRFIGDFKGEKNTFWFIDPPYYLNGKQLYSNYYQKNDHEKLAKTIKRDLEKGHWILTYDVCPEIAEIYSDVSAKKIDLRYSVQTKRTTKEYLFFSGLKID